jgi:HSP20 family protein
MDLVRFDPFSVLNEFERIFDRSPAARAWAPRVDVFDRDESIVVRLDLAGIDPDGIDVTVEGRTLTVSGSRTIDESVEEQGYHRREIFSGEFRRTLVLPGGIDNESITAQADNGMLEITIPRTPEVLPRKVQVDVSKG